MVLLFQCISGAIPTEGIPCLLKVLLPSNCTGLPGMWVYTWLDIKPYIIKVFVIVLYHLVRNKCGNWTNLLFYQWKMDAFLFLKWVISYFSVILEIFCSILLHMRLPPGFKVWWFPLTSMTPFIQHNNHFSRILFNIVILLLRIFLNH